MITKIPTIKVITFPLVVFRNSIILDSPLLQYLDVLNINEVSPSYQKEKK